MITEPTLTLAEAVASSLRQTAQAFHAGAEDPPVAVIWTDPDNEWAPALDLLSGLMPELIQLGDYAPEKRQGPVIWLKTALAGRIEGIALPKDRTPVIYLPGVSRHELRNADQCRWDIQPLVELAYRGIAWTHKNGRDWSVEGYLVADDGLGLDLAQDERTRLSLHTSLGVLAGTPIGRLQGKRLEASDFDSLMVGDTPRDLLLWIGLGDEAKTQWTGERWHAFRSRCQDEFGFDPDKEGPIHAAEQLGKREGAWGQVWDRLCEAPAMYGGVRDQLAQAQPTDALAFDPEPWPRENEAREAKLAAELGRIEQLSPHDARDKITALEEEHGIRRSWVWAKVGECSHAELMDPLSRLAQLTRAIPSFSSIEKFSEWYAGGGWQADAAAMDSLECAHGTSAEEVSKVAIRAIYGPWLEEVCTKFQALAAGGIPITEGEVGGEGECLLFVDGLRMDLAQRLMATLERDGVEVEMATRYSALPTVTATAKPSVLGVLGVLAGEAIPPGFEPNDPSGKALTTARFRKMLDEAGIQRVDADAPSAPSEPTDTGWCETGKVDHRGHDLGAELPAHCPGEIDRAVAVINRLSASGWSKIRIVTDHGWLLMPGGLEKHDLPGFLVESRWSRCAAIKGQSKPDVPTAPWRWNETEYVAVAPGAKSFKGGVEYSHGGISPQECILPVLHVKTSKTPKTSSPSIEQAKWRRQRCTVQITNPATGISADIRHHANDADSSILGAPKEVEADGEVSLLVADEGLEGSPVIVVLLDAQGKILAQTPTTVGG